MINNNPNFGIVNSSLKPITFTIAISPSKTFTILTLPNDYQMTYYYIGDNQTINGIEIQNKYNRPFLIIPDTQIASYITSSGVYVKTATQPLLVQTTYPETICCVSENQKYIWLNAFSMNSNLYPFTLTFYIID